MSVRTLLKANDWNRLRFNAVYYLLCLVRNIKDNMICRDNCPRKTKCKPLSNVVADDDSTFVCIGLHGEEKIDNDDKFRHCFKSATTDSTFDYDEYDLKSVISTMADALLIDELSNN